MNRYKTLCVGLIVGLIAAIPPAAAQHQHPPRDRVVVSVNWLEGHIDDDNLVLIQVGDEDSYPKEHIPGAYPVDFEAFSAPRGEGELALELPDPAVLQDALRRMGITQESIIIVYQADEWLTPTARILLTLQWAGLGRQTRVLDGGITAWKAAGLEVTAEPPAPGSGSVVVEPRRDLIVDASFVEGVPQRSGFALVDARSAEWYSGARSGRSGARGHIPGALNVDWRELVDDETMLLKTDTELRRVFEQAGVAEGDVIVGYCHVGQYATMMLMAARAVGHEVRLYDGSFEDWSRRELPTEADAELEPSGDNGD